jgi:hypothetical protein
LHHHGGPRREAREGIDPMRCLIGLNIVAVDINAVSLPQDDNGMAAHLYAQMNSEALTVLCRQLGLVPRGRTAGRPPVPGRCVQRHRIRAPRSPPPGTR